MVYSKTCHIHVFYILLVTMETNKYYYKLFHTKNIQLISLIFSPSSFQDPALAKYKLTGVADAFSKHKDSGESKGVKAHFRLDESGLLSLDQVSLIKNISN